MTDGYGREINYLRISVTDRCNLRCCYCMPAQGVPSMDHRDILTLEEITRLCRVFAGLGIDRIKVTGGEPLVRRGVVDWIGSLKAVPGIRQVTLTSNGVALAPYARRLARAGLDGVNISLDALDRRVFGELAGFDGLKEVLAGLDAAESLGIPVKINCVPIAGLNEDQLAPIARLARHRVRAVRFIELMPVGLGRNYSGIGTSEVMTRLEKELGRMEPCHETLGNGPAAYWSVPGFRGKIGFIHPISGHICGRCNRIRLTADGQLKLCLAHEEGTDLRGPLREGDSDSGIRDSIVAALARKPKRHIFGAAPAGARGMNAIGG